MRKFNKGDIVIAKRNYTEWRVVSWYHCPYEKDYFYRVESLDGISWTEFWGKDLKKSDGD